MKKESLEKIVAVLIVTLITLASCQKDDEIREPVILLERLSSIRHHNNSLYAVFEYDKKNRITKRQRYYFDYGEVLYDTRTMVYNNHGDLVKFKKGEIDIITEFIKNGNRLSYVERGIPVEVELNTQGLPVKKTYHHIGEIRDFDTKTLYLTWENGNLTHVDKKSFAEEYDYSVTYTYDDLKSPFYNCATPKWFLLYWLDHAYCSENNIETVKYSYSAEAIISEKTYNDDGFIASRKGWNSVLGEVYHYELK